MGVMANIMASASLKSLQAQGLAEAVYMLGKDIWRLKPKTAQHVAQLLHWAQENGQRLAVTVRDASLMGDPVWLDLSQLRQVRQHDVEDFIIQVETGITFGMLTELLSEHYQCFPLSYPAEMTLGEILAYDWPSLESGFKGYPRDFVLKTEIATPDGKLTVSGADVVKNVAGYDLHKFYTGARHAFGVITTVTLKLQAMPASSRYWVYTLDSLTAAAELADELIAHRLPIQACEVYQDLRDWRLLVEASGEPSLLLDCETSLLALTQPLMPRTVGEKAAQGLMHQLQMWPSDQMVVEVTVPPARCRALAGQLSGLAWVREYEVKIQMRRAAGLFYLVAASLPLEVLDEIQSLSQQYEGFMQMMQLPPKRWGDASLMSLPTNLIVRSLLKTLKNGYDPKGVLFTPNMPL
jgi:hypothetical protein